jgi:endonuclease YncB( thermonuclease family)
VSVRSWGPYPGVVDQVHDGDTVYVKLDIGFDLTVYARVRVYGINAAETSTVEGKAARAFAQSLLRPGDLVEVLSHEWDKFGGRVDGEISYGNDASIDFAASMLNAGYAKPWSGRGAKP